MFFLLCFIDILVILCLNCVNSVVGCSMNECGGNFDKNCIKNCLCK